MKTINSIDRENLDHLLESILVYKQEENLKKNIDIYDKEIILYGAGKLGELAIAILNQIGVKVKLVIDKSIEKAGKLLEGIKIISPDDIDINDKNNSIFAICTVNVPFSELYEFLQSYGCKNIVPFFDLIQEDAEKIGMSNGWICNQLSIEDKRDIVKVYEGFYDDVSRALFLQVLYWRIRRKEIFFKDAKVTIGEKFFPKDIILTKLKEDEVFVDCGAYNGYIIKDFLEACNYKFKKIIAFEPDCKNYRELNKYISTLEDTIQSKIDIFNYGVGEKKEKQYFFPELGEASKVWCNEKKAVINIDTIDNMMINDNISYLKIHVEGYELKVLNGALDVINKNRPIIGITIYHNEEGLWKVTKFIMENLKEYTFYNRLHCYCGIASVLYAIPNERMTDKEY